MPKFADVFSDLGIKNQTHHIAILKALDATRQFKYQAVHRALFNMGKWEENKPLDRVFEEFIHVIDMNKRDDGFVNAHALNRHNFPDFIDPLDMADYIVYATQSLFSVGFEALNDTEKKALYECAQALGLFDEITPSRDQFDETYIYGASRVVTQEMRIPAFIKAVQGGVDSGQVRLLSGNRKLDHRAGVRVAGFDGIECSKAQKIEESLRFRKILAREHNKKAETSYRSTADFFEADMMVHAFKEATNSPYNLINFEAENGIPTTRDTLIEAGHRLVGRIKSGEFGERRDIYILCVSNQPYAARQNAEAAQVLEEVLNEAGLFDYKLHIETIGPKPALKGMPLLKVGLTETAKMIKTRYEMTVPTIERVRDFDTLKGDTRKVIEAQNSYHPVFALPQGCTFDI